MRARPLAFLDDGDGDLAEGLHQLLIVGHELTETDRPSKAGRTRPDEEDAHLDELILPSLRRDHVIGRTVSGRETCGDCAHDRLVTLRISSTDGSYVARCGYERYR